VASKPVKPVYYEIRVKAAWRKLYYLKTTANLGIKWTRRTTGQNKPWRLEAWVNADHAHDPDRRLSRSGYIIRANGNIIDFGTGLQPKTASSTPVAEYVALASLTKQLILILAFVEVDI